MFTKLLKYEWRATRGMLGTLCLICLAASLLGGGTMRYLVQASTQDTHQNVFVVLNVLAMVAAIIAVAVIGVAALFLLIGRFYRSRFTDEGYLTFTLPVNTHQNLLSSMVNSAIGMVIIFVVICFCILLWLGIGFSGIDGFYKTLWEAFPRLWEEFGKALAQIRFRYAVLLLLNFLCSFACELVVLMLSVTIGSIIAKKHKILAAVGVYYGIHVAISMVTSAILAMQAIAAEGVEMFFSFQSISAVQMAVIAVAGYFLMYWLVDRKLNLN